MSNGPKPLSGIRVLDFGRYIAGPYCAAVLADHGADVIRIEKVGGNEDRFTVPVAADGSGAGFLQMNRNKRSAAFALTSPAGRAIVRRLVESADVVVANMPAAGLEKAGLDYAALSAINPRVILVSASAFGEVGPMAGRVGFDSVGQAMSGTVHLSGTPDQPSRSQANYVDFATALYSALGVMFALRERERTGRGQQVSATLLGTAASISNALGIDHALTGVERQPMGNRAYGSGPTDIFRVKDGWIMVQVVSNAIFARWAALIGEPDLVHDPRFANDMARGDNGTALSAKMAMWCAERTRDEAIEALGRAGVPAGPVLPPSAVMAHPQMRALGFVEDVTYPGTSGTAPIMATPIALSASPRDPLLRPPLAGEHTAAVLAEIGYTAEEIAALAGDGVI